MIATFINAAAIIVGSIIGLLVGNQINPDYRRVVFSGIGVVTLIIGTSMALETQRFLYLALALVVGGLLGTWFHVEDGIYAAGRWIRRRIGGESTAGDPLKGTAADSEGDTAVGAEHRFAQGFLTASILFCVGALTILGAFQAGVEGEYGLILTKSVLDGFMAILLTAAYGMGVAFSAISILVYQGGLTLLAVVISPFVSDLMLSEVSGVGGAMVLMIGLNLLDLRQIKTADFLPALVVVALFVLIDPWIGAFVL